MNDFDIHFASFLEQFLKFVLLFTHILLFVHLYNKSFASLTCVLDSNHFSSERENDFFLFSIKFHDIRFLKNFAAILRWWVRISWEAHWFLLAWWIKIWALRSFSPVFRRKANLLYVMKLLIDHFKSVHFLTFVSNWFFFDNLKLAPLFNKI